ncbi:MAG: endonuclease VIII [Planctomycetota bacterium]
MPEGPEIRRVADRLQRAIGGRRLADVRFAHEHLKPHEDELRGSAVERVTSRGKALVTYFDNGRALYTHNQLYGVWRVCAAGKPPRTARSLRVALETAERWALLYSASEIEVLDAEDVEEHPFVAKLGPDLLDRTTSVDAVVERLGDPRFARRTLGALLLDQGFLAGVGNYLRSEILFFAGLDAARKPRDLTDAQRRELASQAVGVTRRAYRTGGLTEAPEALAAAKAAGEPRRSYRHAVFGRAGAPCRRCGRQVRREEVAGRRLYRCTGCQRRR